MKFPTLKRQCLRGQHVVLHNVGTKSCDTYSFSGKVVVCAGHTSNKRPAYIHSSLHKALIVIRPEEIRSLTYTPCGKICSMSAEQMEIYLNTSNSARQWLPALLLHTTPTQNGCSVNTDAVSSVDRSTACTETLKLAWFPMLNSPSTFHECLGGFYERETIQ